MTVKFAIVDNTQPINFIRSSESLEVILMEYLYLIRDQIMKFRYNNINNIDLYNFNYLQCFAYKLLQSNAHFIINKYTFDIKTLTIVDNNNVSIQLPSEFNLIINELSKLQIGIKQNNTIIQNNTINQDNNIIKPIPNFNRPMNAQYMTDNSGFSKPKIIISDTKNQPPKKDTYDSNNIDFINKSIQENEIRKSEFKRKEKLTEQKNRFDANKKAYLMMKKNIETGLLKEDKIPILFEKEYPIYKFMDNTNILNTDNAFETFFKLYDELYKTNVKPEYVDINDNGYADLMLCEPVIPKKSNFNKNKNKNKNIGIKPYNDSDDYSNNNVSSDSDNDSDDNINSDNSDNNDDDDSDNDDSDNIDGDDNNEDNNNLINNTNIINAPDYSYINRF